MFDILFAKLGFGYDPLSTGDINIVSHFNNMDDIISFLNDIDNFDIRGIKTFNSTAYTLCSKDGILIDNHCVKFVTIKVLTKRRVKKYTRVKRDRHNTVILHILKTITKLVNEIER